MVLEHAHRRVGAERERVLSVLELEPRGRRADEDHERRVRDAPRRRLALRVARVERLLIRGEPAREDVGGDEAQPGARLGRRSRVAEV